MSIIINIDDTPSGVTIDAGRTDNAISAELAALSARIDLVSVGGASVTSNELSVSLAAQLSNRVSADGVLSAAITIVSNAISAEIVNRTSADNALSAQIATNSAQMTSADGRLSNTITNLAVDDLANVSAPSPGDQQVLTFNSASGLWVASTMAAGSGSVTSNELSTGLAAVSSQAASIVSVLGDRVGDVESAMGVNSAQMTSADNAISNAVSIVSVAQAATSAAVTSVNNRVSAISSNVTSVAGRLDTVSALISTAVSALSQALSAKTISSLIGVSIAGATDQQVLTYNSADGKWHASTVAAGSGSVTSTELSAAVAALSNAISAKTISSLAGVSITGATDQQVLTYNSADGKWHASTKGGTATDVQLVSSLPATNAQGYMAMVSTDGRLYFGTSTNILAEVPLATTSGSSANQILGLNSANNAWELKSLADTSTIVWAHSAGIIRASAIGGVGSVTSTELSAAAAALSVRIDTQSQGISVLSQQVSVLSARVAGVSAQMTSADNAISNAVSIVSVAQAATSAAVTSVNNRVSGISTAVTNNSAQMTSADNAISNAVSIVSVAQAATSAAVTSVNNRVSGISTTVTNNSAQMTSADNAISNAVSVETAARIAADNALSNAISTKTISSLIGVSIPSAGDQQVLTYNSAAGQWVASTIVAGAGSVTSTELSSGLAGVSAQAASIVSVANDRISALSTTLTSVQSAVSAVSAAQAVTSANVTSVNNRVSALRYSKGITISAPVVGDDIDLAVFESAVTIRKIMATMIGATTPTAVWTLRTDSVRSAAGTEIITGGQTQSSTSAAQSYTTLNQSAIGAGNILWLEVTSVGGSVNSLHATIIYTKD